MTCKWVLFSTIDLYFYQLAQNVGKQVYNRLVSACTVKNVIEVQRLCVSTSKRRHFCQLFLPSFLFACDAPSRAIWRLEWLSQTHLTLVAIPVKVGVNNSLIFCHYKHTRKILPSLGSFTVYNSLITDIQKNLRSFRSCRNNNSLHAIAINLELSPHYTQHIPCYIQ